MILTLENIYTILGASAREIEMTFRIINTKDAIKGPTGIPYIHDAARPFAVLVDRGRGEITAGRFPTEQAAKAAIENTKFKGVR
jgi:hypothetical protein